MPPEPIRLVADLDAALLQQILTFRSDKGKQKYSMTARRIISKLVLNHLKGR